MLQAKPKPGSDDNKNQALGMCIRKGVCGKAENGIVLYGRWVEIRVE